MQRGDRKLRGMEGRVSHPDQEEGVQNESDEGDEASPLVWAPNSPVVPLALHFRGLMGADTRFKSVEE